MGQSKGNRKSSKRDEPKRKRYNAERRGFVHRVRALEKHIAKHPDDEQAKAALILAKDMLTKPQMGGNKWQ